MKTPILQYTFWAYAITWALTLGLYALYKSEILSFAQLNVLYVFGSLGPFISAWYCTRKYYGSSGVQKLREKFALAYFNPTGFLLSISPLLFLLIGYLLYPVLTGQVFTFQITIDQFGLHSSADYIAWLLPFFAYVIFEEVGWRGFLLPHLQEKYSAFAATGILTFIWALWHLPFFLFRFQFTPFILVGFFIGMFVGAIILTAIYNTMNGGLLGVILFHLTNNIASAFDKNIIVAVVSTGFLLFALLILLIWKPRHLARSEKIGNYFIANEKSVSAL